MQWESELQSWLRQLSRARSLFLQLWLLRVEERSEGVVRPQLIQTTIRYYCLLLKCASSCFAWLQLLLRTMRPLQLYSRRRSGCRCLSASNDQRLLKERPLDCCGCDAASCLASR